MFSQEVNLSAKSDGVHEILSVEIFSQLYQSKGLEITFHSLREDDLSTGEANCTVGTNYS